MAKVLRCYLFAEALLFKPPFGFSFQCLKGIQEYWNPYCSIGNANYFGEMKSSLFWGLVPLVSKRKGAHLPTLFSRGLLSSGAATGWPADPICAFNLVET